jgi:hypothetical protein
MQDDHDIVAILVALHIGEQQSLFALLSADGCINRMGSGTVDEIDRDLYMGQVPPGLFEQLRAKVTPGVVHFLGRQLEAPDPRGKLCKLQVGFQYATGREDFSIWRYGSDSLGPHPEICAFVEAAVRLTEPWYQAQKVASVGL